ncbi:MAG: CopG family transcriptional regulator [Solirubrobacterales bacterium]
MRRTQIYLDAQQDRALRDRAQADGRTKSAVIRDAIDSYLAPSGDDRAAVAHLRTAVSEASGAARHLPSGADYVDEVRAGDVAREDELAERRSD